MSRGAIAVDPTMHRYTVYAAYGWLLLTGILHFAVDVVAQYLRGQRAPGVETTLYYGLNTAFSLGQVAFGALGLLVAWRGIGLAGETPALLLALATGLGWLAVACLFMTYWEPKANVAIFCAVVVVALVTR